MRTLIVIVAVLCAAEGYGQDFVGTDFLNFEPKNYVGEREVLMTDSIFSEEGDLTWIRVIEDGQQVNYHFDEQGRQVLRCEVTTRLTIDTTYTMDLDSGDIVEEVSSGYVDVPNGKFERRSAFNGAPGLDGYNRTIGSYSMGLMQGVWSIRMPMEQVIVTVELNDNGFTEGAYRETYLRSGQVKWTGEYAMAEFRQMYYDFDTGEEIGILLEGPLRSGTWRRYSNWDDSKLTDEIEYKHY